jgi:hypothetical protein
MEELVLLDKHRVHVLLDGLAPIVVHQQQLVPLGVPIVGWGMDNVILPVISRLVILIKGIAALRAQMEVCAI